MAATKRDIYTTRTVNPYLQNGHVVRHLDLAAGTASGLSGSGCPLSGSMGHLPPPNLIGDSGGFLTRYILP